MESIQEFVDSEPWLGEAIELALGIVDERREFISETGTVKSLEEAQLLWEVITLLERLRLVISRR